MAVVRLGVLDVGSISATLDVVELDRELGTQRPWASKARTRLAESTRPDGTLTRGGIDRVITAINQVMDKAVEARVERVACFGTSALRDATNQDEVTERIRRETGIPLGFLAPEEEARLTFLAARRWCGARAGKLLVLDLGGGTMEFAGGEGETPHLAASLPLGIARLTRELLPGDCPTPTHLQELRDRVHDALHPLLPALTQQRDHARVLGTSKILGQLARLTASDQHRTSGEELVLRRRELRQWIPRLASMSPKKRSRLPGISNRRARTSLAGAVITHAALRALDVRELHMCPWALREGVVLSMQASPAIAHGPNTVDLAARLRAA